MKIKKIVQIRTTVLSKKVTDWTEWTQRKATRLCDCVAETIYANSDEFLKHSFNLSMAI